MQQFMQFQKTLARYVQNTKPDVPPNIVVHAPRLASIKAVAFDVYGTLLHSAAGEISTSEVVQQRELEFPHVGVRVPSATLSRMLEREIRAQHAAKHAQGIRYPEVDIVHIWEKLLQHEAIFSKAVTTKEALRACAMETALCYELQVNPVSRMPQALQVIRSLHTAGIALGIVSNAQFYTPHVLAYLLSQASTAGTSAAVQESGTVLDMFSACVWSYQLGEGKPSARLYEKLLALWPRYKAHEILFVGNDMRNDIAPPASLGIKTALFAGDAQSYRPRKDMKELEGIKPEACITDLMSIAHIVGAA